MKPARAFAIAAAACAAALALALPSAPAHSYSSGAPPAFSGPEQYCNACHSDGGDPGTNPVNSGTGSVTITAPATFVPGEPVTITVTVVNTDTSSTRKQGFELSARSAADSTNVGSFTVDGTSVQYAQLDTLYVTHTSTSNTGTTWTFAWTAPETGAPDLVRFFAAGNAANGNGFPDAGDKIYADTHTIRQSGVANEPGATALPFRLAAPFPNPARTTATARYALDRPAEVTARLLDGRGRVVRVFERGARGAGTHDLRLDVSGLAAGTYFLSLSTAEGTQVQPLAVAR